MNNKAGGMLLAAGLLAAPAAQALDGVALELGGGDDSTGVVRAALFWDWDARWFAEGAWHVGGYWELDAGYWHADSGHRGHRDIAEIGLTPVFRLQQNDPGDAAFYLEAGIGVHFLSHTKINEDRDFSTAFQFGDLAGFGVQFGHRHAWELGYRFQHLSNGGIENPNDGIGLHLLRLAYRMD